MGGAGGLAAGPDGAVRCAWCETADDYRRYHDEEWGRPEGDDRALFEKACLEGFQSGLSWLTILRKRENFRRAFDGFDIEAVARYGEADIARLLGDAGIVRHRGKIEAVVNNARQTIALKSEFGSLAAFFWSFEPAPESRPAVIDLAAAGRARTAESEAMSRALKRRGWRFVGPVTCHALMQAMGLVNDHLEGCAFRAPVEAARAAFERPRRNREKAR